MLPSIYENSFVKSFVNILFIFALWQKFLIYINIEYVGYTNKKIINPFNSRNPTPVLIGFFITQNYGKTN